MRRALLPLAAGLLWTGVTAADASPWWPRHRPVLTLRLEGALVRARDAATGPTVVSMEFLGQEAAVQRWLDVERVRTVGDQILGQDVLAAFAPFRPNLIVVGPPGLARQLLAVPAGDRVVLEGVVHRTARSFHLRRVEPLP